VSGALVEGLQIGVAVTAFGLGMRHGIDWDHLAAITDLTSSAPDRRRGLLHATLYATGHALVVFLLGLAAIALGARLPDGADRAMQVLVGLSLVALAVWVAASLLRDGRSFTLRSRWSLIASLVGRLVDRWRRWRRDGDEVVVIEHEHEHPGAPDHDRHPIHGHAEVRAPVHARVAIEGLAAGEAAGEGRSVVATRRSRRHTHIGHLPEDPFTRYGRVSSFFVGMLHGIGAETPTQVIVLAAAAGIGGGMASVVFLAVFLAGLFCSNTLVAMGSLAGLFDRERAFPVYVALSVVVATFSFGVGLLLLLGRAEALPTLLGG